MKCVFPTFHFIMRVPDGRARMCPSVRRPGRPSASSGPQARVKSTLVNLIPRFYDATGGTVTMDGLDVTRTDDALRSAVAVVPQKALLFTGTILENLRWGKPDATREQAVQAARLACADDFIRQTPQGYDTVLGQGGVNLSGGQKQRLALARALIRQPRVLILDDCTSALDRRPRPRYWAACGGWTHHCVSHQPAHCHCAQSGPNFVSGKRPGAGIRTHEELMARCSTYRAIYLHRSEGEIMADRSFTPPPSHGRYRSGLARANRW